MKVYKKRRLSRLIAVQSLHQYDFINRTKDLKQTADELVDNYTLDAELAPTSYRQKIDEDFLYQLLSLVALGEKEVMEEIINSLKDVFSLEKIDNVILQIIRLGGLELKFITEIPTKVVIDEYTTIASSFFGDKQTKFVNGILQSLAKSLRSNDS